MDNLTIITSCESKPDGHKDYAEMAVRLAYSVRKNGGKAKDVPIVMWYGEDLPPSADKRAILEGFGCKLVAGKVRYPDKRLFNKVTAMATPVDTEYSLWVDTDIYVLKDFSGMLEGTPDISASPTNYCFHRWANFKDKPKWDEFYRSAGMVNPDKTLLTDMDQKEGIFYLCSGLVLFKNGINFPETYFECAEAVLASSVENRVENFSQTSLTVATVKGDYKFKVFPEKYQVYYALSKRIYDDTILVHYQDNVVTEIPESDWNAGGLLGK